MRFDEILQPQLKRYRLILNNLKNGIVLDLGSEMGELHEFLVKNTDSKIIGVDILKGKNVDVVCDLNNKFPFPDNYADSIVGGDIIEHMLNPFHFLKECHRVLKPNGKLILTTDNMLGLQNFVTKINIWEKKYRPNPHLYAWSIELLVPLIEKAGFKVEKKIMLNVRWRMNLLFRFICFCIPKIRPRLFVVAKKLK